jgi:hypothetical protein
VPDKSLAPLEAPKRFDPAPQEPAEVLLSIAPETQKLQAMPEKLETA